jgi:hypothetical protein
MFRLFPPWKQHKNVSLAESHPQPALERGQLRFVVPLSTPPTHSPAATKQRLISQRTAKKVVFCTGGSGTICSGQVRALVALGANACIVGRNRQKVEKVAAEISAVRPGSRVLGIGDVDVRSFDTVQAAVDRTVKELGGIDFVM